jgi:hypothetical protein
MFGRMRAVIPQSIMERPPLLANTIWAGSFPYGFRFFGLHVLAELLLEACVVRPFHPVPKLLKLSP